MSKKLEIGRPSIREAIQCLASDVDEFKNFAADFKTTRGNEDEGLFLDADLRINHLLLHACHNKFAARCLSGFSRRHFDQYKHLIDIKEIAERHEKIALSIAKRDQLASAAALDD